MNRSLPAVTVFALSLASAVATAAAAFHKSSPKAKAPERAEGLFFDLSGPEPIQVECVKKPLPVFTVYQY